MTSGCDEDYDGCSPSSTCLIDVDEFYLLTDDMGALYILNKQLRVERFYDFNLENNEARISRFYGGVQFLPDEPPYSTLVFTGTTYGKIFS